MNATQIAAIRKQLLADRERIVTEWQDHRSLTSTGDDPVDLVEQAEQITSESVDRRIVEDDVHLLRKIDFALQRIDAGTYQQCEECGAAIPIGRLMAKPSASLCLACQEMKDALKP